MHTRHLLRCVLALLLAGMTLPHTSWAQSLSGRFVTALTDGGGTLEVTVQVKSERTPSFNLGPATFQFMYNLGALSYPLGPVEGTDYAFSAFHPDANNNYLGTSLTHPSGRTVSLNIFIFSPGNGTAVATSDYMDVAMIRFKVLDGGQLANLRWTLCEYASDDFTLEETGCGLFQDQDAPLPVELTRFDAQQERDGIRLTWATASETNNAGFEIQMMPRDDAAEGNAEPQSNAAWQTLAFVPGAGTTNVPQGYTHLVPNLSPGRYGFRLKQIDIDGSYQIGLPVEAVWELPGAYQLTAAYPNPFDHATRFALAVAQTQHVSLALYDTRGRLVQALHDGVMEAGRTHAFVVRAAGLPAGMYVYRAAGENFTENRSVMVVR